MAAGSGGADGACQQERGDDHGQGDPVADGDHNAVVEHEPQEPGDRGVGNDEADEVPRVCCRVPKGVPGVSPWPSTVGLARLMVSHREPTPQDDSLGPAPLCDLQR